MNVTAITTEPAAAESAEERGFDPFASLPETPTADAAESAPEQPADPIAPLKAELDELKAWRQEQLKREQEQAAEQQQVRQSQAEQVFKQEQDELVQLATQAAVGLDEAERGRLFRAVEDAAWGRVFNRPEAKQQLAGIVAQAQEYQEAQATWGLIRETFGHNMSMARALELHDRLMKVRDPVARKEVAQALVSGQRQQNLDSGVGQIRTEGPGNGGYSPAMNAKQRYLRWLQTGEGPRPSSEEIDRLTAGYLR